MIPAKIMQLLSAITGIPAASTAPAWSIDDPATPRRLLNVAAPCLMLFVAPADVPGLQLVLGMPPSALVAHLQQFAFAGLKSHCPGLLLRDDSEYGAPDQSPAGQVTSGSVSCGWRGGNMTPVRFFTRRWDDVGIASALSETLAKPWRTSQEQAIYAASRINQLRKSSSAASQLLRCAQSSAPRAVLGKRRDSFSLVASGSESSPRSHSLASLRSCLLTLSLGKRGASLPCSRRRRVAVYQCVRDPSSRRCVAPGAPSVMASTNVSWRSSTLTPRPGRSLGQTLPLRHSRNSGR